jgi:hypothetical protein
MLAAHDRIPAPPDRRTVAGGLIGDALRRSRRARRLLTALALQLTRLAFGLRRAGRVTAALSTLQLAHGLGHLASGRPSRGASVSP